MHYDVECDGFPPGQKTAKSSVVGRGSRHENKMEGENELAGLKTLSSPTGGIQGPAVARGHLRRQRSRTLNTCR